MEEFSSRFGTKHDLILRALQCEYSMNRLPILKSDYGYIIPHIQLVSKLAADHVNTYFYSFDYRSPYMTEPKWM
ncbi:hypothetical protein KUTeg_011793, partial [Tegillarca granosa]